MTDWILHSRFSQVVQGRYPLSGHLMNLLIDCACTLRSEQTTSAGYWWWDAMGTFKSTTRLGCVPPRQTRGKCRGHHWRRCVVGATSGEIKRYEVVDRGCEQGPKTWELSERRHEVSDQITVVGEVQKLAKRGLARLGSRESSPQVRV